METETSAAVVIGTHIGRIGGHRVDRRVAVSVDAKERSEVIVCGGGLQLEGRIGRLVLRATVAIRLATNGARDAGYVVAGCAAQARVAAAVVVTATGAVVCFRGDIFGGRGRKWEGGCRN